MDNTQDISQEEWETLERYLHHRLTPAERIEFESQLSANVSLQSKLVEVRLLMVAIGEPALQEKLNDFHREMPATAKEYHIRSKSSHLKNWLIAASVLLIVGVGGWLLLNGNSNEKLFASYFRPDPGLITAMSATDNYVFEKAMIDYKRGDYPSAIQAWDSLQKIQPENDTLNYFLGVANLANENPKQAVMYLQKVTVSATGFFKDDAYWYLGLALMKEGKKEEAKTVIQKSTHPSKEELLQKLN
ncbi:MAG: hypothetical protein EON98_01065 [Chitinophagaceae bacterium]|nr:MAG: hypothetical protein EON98_01065 [Chitinophagaceae bacterium]